MCDTCTRMHLEDCPPRNTGDPDPEVVADRDVQIGVEWAMAALTIETAPIDATTELVLRSRLGSA